MRRSFRRKYSADQKALGLFVGGMSKKVIEDRPMSNAGEMMTPYPTTGDGYRKPWRGRDCLDGIIGVMMSIQGMKVLVCPTCKVDLDPHLPPKFPEPYGELVVDNRPKENLPNFCKCLKCGQSYFIYEIIKQKSFRQKLSTDEGKEFLFYADAGTIINISIDGFHEEFRFVR